MIQVLGSVWALLLGMLLLTLGNGMQGTLLGIRGGIEGFSTIEISVVMSAYFVGFLFGSKITPELIRRVGHVRVFAALGSFVSAILILYPTMTEPWIWAVLRVAFGICFAGVYVTAESWLNNAVTNENRGKALSLYAIAMMAGVTIAQAVIGFGDPSGFVLFIIPSVLVSISFAPILLSISPTPAFEATKPMSLVELYNTSPLGFVGMFLLGGIFSALFGMSAVYGSEAGMTVAQISMFVASFYLGGLILQYPIGWISDRMDRRVLILAVSAAGGVAALLGIPASGFFPVLLVVGFIVGGLSNPLYSLFLAYTNDMLDGDNMAAASGGLVFINGVGAIAGPMITGWLLGVIGPPGFWMFLGTIMLATAAYAAWRMARRPSTSTPEETVSYAPIYPTASPVAVEAAQEYYAESLEDLVTEDVTNETEREAKG